MEPLIEYLQQEKIEYIRPGVTNEYTTIKIGGRVGLIVIVKHNQHLIELLERIKEAGLPFVLLGGGSNIIFPDEAPDLVLIINRTAEIKDLGNNVVKVDGGVTIANLMAWCSRHRAGGLEFLAGIPGTIGGAAAVNAGAFGRAVSEILESAEIVTNDSTIKSVQQNYFQYGYRCSIFKTGSETILNVFLRYIPLENEEIKSKITDHIRYRKEKHPSYKLATAGCFFKNPLIDNRRTSAGRLIEQAGLKGLREERLMLSDIHANFVVNRGAATFRDINRFAQKIADRIFKKEGIRLEREIIYVSPAGKKY